MKTNNFIDELCINAIRMTSMHQINAAKSGHPGIALGAAPIIHTVYTRHLNVDPNEPNFLGRDRFVLSAGHGSSMLYSTLHLAGFGITIDDLKQFRQLKSITPGHPEIHVTPGVDVSTGPLGQGVATAVGLVIASEVAASTFNKYQTPLFDNYTYVLCGDGDLQEGVAIEALNIAGGLMLDKLIVLYDSNDIQLDGKVSDCYNVDVKKKYEAMGFNYILVEEGNCVDDIDQAIIEAKKSNKPSLIEIKTIIGHGSGFAGDSSSHGSPLGKTMTAELAMKLDWKFEPFEIPEQCYEYYDETLGARGYDANQKFNIMLSDYITKYGDDHEGITGFINGDRTIDISKFDITLDKLATRDIASKMFNEVCRQVPFIVGGSADLSKATKIKGANGSFASDNRYGKNVLFGVREHAMGSIANGISLFAGFVGIGSTFLAFSDYMKPAIRMAALMELPSVFVFSHDSLAVGEDGPTHQPIEHLAMLRSIPNCNVIRPCDAQETAQCMKLVFENKKNPSVIITTRQNLDMFENKSCKLENGAYVIQKEKGGLDVVLVASGSEVSLAIHTSKVLAEKGIKARVVSMPSQYLFDKQKDSYKESILPKGTPVVAVELSHPMSWYKYTPNVYGVETFGISAPASSVLDEFGFTPDKLATYVTKILK